MNAIAHFIYLNPGGIANGIDCVDQLCQFRVNFAIQILKNSIQCLVRTVGYAHEHAARQAIH